MDMQKINEETNTALLLSLLLNHLCRCENQERLRITITIDPGDNSAGENFADFGPDAKSTIFAHVKARYEHLYRQSKERLRGLVLEMLREDEIAPEAVGKVESAAQSGPDGWHDSCANEIY